MARIRHGKQRESLEQTKLVNAHRLTKGLFRCISHTLGRNTRDDFSTLLFWFQRRSTLYKHVDSRALVTGTSFIAAKEVTADLWFSNSRTVHGRLTAEPWHQETTMSPKRIRHHSSEIRQKWSTVIFLHLQLGNFEFLLRSWNELNRFVNATLPAVYNKVPAR